MGLLLLVCLAAACTPDDIYDYFDDDGADEEQVYQTKLSGDQEVPEEVHTRASGQAVLELSEDGTSLHFRITVNALEDFLAGHIHIGAPDENGPVVAYLVPIEPYPFTEFIDDPLFPGVTNGLLGEGVITSDHLIGPLEGATITDLVHEIEAGNAYVNLHTSEYPAGEIRGNF